MSVRYVLVDLLVLRLETLLRPLVPTVLAPVRVAKIINLDDYRHIRFKHQGIRNGTSRVLLHGRFHLLTTHQLLADHSYLEPSPA